MFGNIYKRIITNLAGSVLAARCENNLFPVQSPTGNSDDLLSDVHDNARDIVNTVFT